MYNLSVQELSCRLEEKEEREREEGVRGIEGVGDGGTPDTYGFCSGAPHGRLMNGN